MLFFAVCPALAAEVSLQVVYSDVASGHLTIAAEGNLPLPDGCVGQVIEHIAEGSIVPPDKRGRPVDGDRSIGLFYVNGSERLGVAGYFACKVAFDADAVPEHPVYLRIWNAADPAEATLYYQSPLCEVTDGAQQLNFAREQLTCHDGTDALTTGAQPYAPTAYNVLVSYPNPFNAEATFGFALEHDARVMIDLYDVQGRIVRTLVNGHLQAGTHRYAMQAAELASGVYFATRRVNDASVSTVWVILIK